MTFSIPTSTTIALTRSPLRRLLGSRRGLRELGLLVVMYVAYSGTRLVADDAFGPAVDRAHALYVIEQTFGLAWERAVNQLFVDVEWLGLVGSYWYATAHYVLTAAVLVWLYRRGPNAYVPARRALLLASVAALVLYLLVPMAPPRLVPEYVDVLRLHAASGWWGGEASAPRGLGGLTNQLAAFPSLHAGWALWVALAVGRAVSSRVVCALAWCQAVLTAVVVIGTGNHWVLDVVVGWLLVAVAYAAVAAPGIGWTALRQQACRAAARLRRTCQGPTHVRFAFLPEPTGPRVHQTRRDLELHRRRATHERPTHPFPRRTSCCDRTCRRRAGPVGR